MSCMHDLARLPPSSPEKHGDDDAHMLDKALASTLDDTDHEQEQQERQQQQHTHQHENTPTRTPTTTHKHITATPSAPRWEPTPFELESLAMDAFDVIGVLGVGTYGVVKLARHIASGASVALKVLSKEYIVSMRQEKHILRERAVHAQLDHAFIARLYGTFQDDDCLYLVIEYLPGGELWSLVYSDFDNNDDDNGSDTCSDSNELRVVPDGAIAAAATAVAEAPAATGKDTEARRGSTTESLASLERSNTTMDDDDASCRPEHHCDKSDSSEPQCRVLVQSPSGGSRRRSSAFSASTPTMRLDAKSRGLLRNAHGGLRQDFAAFYLASIVCALEYLHAHELLYRDLKLENLVLDASGYLKVLDFGFAKPNATSSATESESESEATDIPRNTTLCGSMDYMAPEILRHEPHDERVDIWSFGIIMYELLLGKTPFYDVNPREVGRMITTAPVTFPEAFERDHAAACDLIRKLLVKAPGDRLRSMQAIKRHAFFATTLFPDARAWDALERKQLRAPFVPVLTGPFDTSFFATMDDAAQDELDDNIEPYFEDGSHIFESF